MSSLTPWASCTSPALACVGGFDPNPKGLGRGDFTGSSGRLSAGLARPILGCVVAICEPYLSLGFHARCLPLYTLSLLPRKCPTHPAVQVSTCSSLRSQLRVLPQEPVPSPGSQDFSFDLSCPGYASRWLLLAKQSLASTYPPPLVSPTWTAGQGLFCVGPGCRWRE